MSFGKCRYFQCLSRCESSIDLPNKSIKDIKTKYVEFNINSPLSSIDSKDCINKDEYVCNNNESNSTVQKIINNNERIQHR